MTRALGCWENMSEKVLLKPSALGTSLCPPQHIAGSRLTLQGPHFHDKLP